MARIYLSKADVGGIEAEFVLDAMQSGWIAPLGPHVDSFEAEIAARVGVEHALALSSGTAALHLGLLGVGAEPGSVVLCPTLTFVATANAITYTGATPVFVDSSRSDGNVEPQLMLDAADVLRREGTRVSAALVVDIFGRCADYRVLTEGLAARGIPMVEDAAESMGATLRDQPAGSFGAAAALSFNGNKIMTTSGGGMLLSDDEALIDRARYLSTQARQPRAWYEHTEVGYNYRLSNVLAALGRGQLTRLDTMIARRQLIRRRYMQALIDFPGVRFLGEDFASHGYNDNCWLTTIQIENKQSPLGVTQLINELEAEDIEARHVWKPMHLQPAFSTHRSFLNGEAERIYKNGLALPSGSSMSDEDHDQVIKRLQIALAA